MTMFRFTTQLISTGCLIVLVCAGCAKQSPPLKTEDNRAKTSQMSSRAGSSASIGQMAPDFELPGLDGRMIQLSELRGRVVVLEWFNPDCPFVKRAHGPGPLADMAKRWTAKGVFWLAINSSGPGKQGHGLDRNRRALTQFQLNHPIALDEDGRIGRLYGAARTPQLYVIGKDGRLAYRGALNNMPFGELTEPGASARHYVDLAIAAVLANQPVKWAQTKPWGCSVKYARP
ncbi:MAG: thioredoxin family protein [Myxococcales bacterium]|nr:thioredoxin family protein [Myxococcales bacterium]